ncbi:VOC family protein [Algoriphagus sp. PAP.12]|jgi:catechol 2,3-dioxygenase-like lactoylglutathione lyase family enzyme|uniref:VOC family protein n=1 Tax=Algoriphagus sp. PAP.12 TaxID=2996678 RepID=UPI00227A9368|nr:VOC family protein [Algoriphagus sp. PAP.12]
MDIEFSSHVVKISSSDFKRSIDFYQKNLGFEIDNRYTINVGGDFGNESYLQMNSPGGCTIGLFKDISAPYSPLPESGTVLSFIMDNLDETLKIFEEKGIPIDPPGIILNTSDEGFQDKFFFFRDPDNNSLVIRENLNS